MIDADELKFPAMKGSFNEIDLSRMDGYSKAIQIVRNAPTIDVAPVLHARWDDDHCTNCNKEASMTYECYGGDDGGFPCESFGYVNSPYCPNCGAKMDGE